MAAVKTAVDGLGSLDVVGPFLVRLGARHVRYGVRPEHFDVVGGALLWTLEQGLGERFTPTVRDAWVAAWDVIADAMQTGMRQAAAALDPRIRLSRRHAAGRSIVRLDAWLTRSPRRRVAIMISATRL